MPCKPVVQPDATGLTAELRPDLKQGNRDRPPFVDETKQMRARRGD
jgi:hypothetical protein